jgi:hypothetical protein
MTLLLDTFTPLGDSVSPGTPFSPEELTYEASIRINCIGDFYVTKYDTVTPAITNMTVSGQRDVMPYSTPAQQNT